MQNKENNVITTISTTAIILQLIYGQKGQSFIIKKAENTNWNLRHLHQAQSCISHAVDFSPVMLNEFLVELLLSIRFGHRFPI